MLMQASKSATFLQQAEEEEVGALKLFHESQEGKSFPAGAVFHCQQAIETRIKSAMLRTCGLIPHEWTGLDAHNLSDLTSRLAKAPADSDAQRLGQQVPGDAEDMVWLTEAYLKTRYPRSADSETEAPAYKYHASDSERALGLARRFLFLGTWGHASRSPSAHQGGGGPGLSSSTAAQPRCRGFSISGSAAPA